MPVHIIRIKKEKIISFEELLTSDEESLDECFFISNDKNIIINIIITNDYNRYSVFINEKKVKNDGYGYKYQFSIDGGILMDDRYYLRNMHSLDNILNEKFFKNELRLSKIKKLMK